MLHPNIKQAIETLIAQGYMVIHKEILTLTDRVLELDTGSLLNKPPNYTKSITLLDSKTKSVIPSPGEQSLLIKFIFDCEVPLKAKSADGRSYYVGKYSKDAEKELVKIIFKQEYQPDILMAATKLYYKSTDFPETLTNFIVNGTWLTHYLEMEKQLTAGTADKHIQKQISEQDKGGALYDSR